MRDLEHPGLRPQHRHDLFDVALHLELDAVRALDHRLQLGRCSDRDDLAAVDDRDAIAQRLRLVHIMRGERNCEPGLAPQPLEQVPHGAPALRVKSDGRLVEEQYFRRMNQPARDLQPPAHPTRVGLHEIVGALSQAHQVDKMLRPLAPQAPGEIVEPAIDVDVLPPGEVEVGGQRLRNHADRLAHASGLTRDVEAGDESLARGRHDQRRQHPAERGLARAVGSEQAEKLATPNFETHMIDGGECAEAFSELACLYCC